MSSVKFKIINNGLNELSIRFGKAEENSTVTPSTGAYPVNLVDTDTEFSFVLGGTFDLAERFVFAGRDTPNFVNLNYISNSADFEVTKYDDESGVSVMTTYTGPIAIDDPNYVSRRVGAFIKLYPGEPEVIFAEPTLGSGFERVVLGDQIDRLTLADVLATKGKFFADDNYYVPLFPDYVTLKSLERKEAPSHLVGVTPECPMVYTSFLPEVVTPIVSAAIDAVWEGVEPSVGKAVAYTVTSNPLDATVSEIRYVSSNPEILSFVDPLVGVGIINAVGTVTVTATVTDGLNNTATAVHVLDTYFAGAPLVVTIDPNYGNTLSATVTGISPSAYAVIGDTYTDIVAGATTATIAETLSITTPTEVKIYVVNGDTSINLSATKAITEVKSWTNVPTDKIEIKDLPNLTRVPTTLNARIKSVVGMFEGCSSFNQDISGWNVAKFTSFDNMFKDAILFNQDISGWNTENVTSMQGTFANAPAFNQPLNTWNLSKVTNLVSFLEGATIFNQELNALDVSKVRDFSYALKGAIAFKKDLSAWNVASATDMTEMFNGVVDYTYKLAGWCVTNITSRPTNFGVPAAFSPVWGTCPAASDITSIIGMPSDLYNSMTYALSINANYPVVSTAWSVTPTNKAIIDDEGSLTILAAESGDQIKVTCLINNYYTVEVAAIVAQTKETLNLEVKGATGSTVQVSFSTPTTVNWGDGSVESIEVSGSHTYTDGTITGPMTVKPVDDTVPYTAHIAGDVTRVLDWGDYPIENIQFGELNSGVDTGITDVPLPLPSTMTDLTNMFTNCTSFNQDLSTLDLTNVTSINGMFRNATTFNKPVNSWNLADSKITELVGVFSNAAAFNQPLNAWDVSKITSMRMLFNNATHFNQPLDNWNTVNVTNMQYMFDGATDFRQVLRAWSVPTITSLPERFATGSQLDTYLHPIWSTSGNNFAPITDVTPLIVEVTTTAASDPILLNVVYPEDNTGNLTVDWGDGFPETYAQTANSVSVSRTYPVGNRTVKVYWSGKVNSVKPPVMTTAITQWSDQSATRVDCSGTTIGDVPNTLPTNITSLSGMFMDCTAFNAANISSWDVTHVTDFTAMFKGATTFNRPVASWIMTSATNITSMFEGAVAFNQPLNTWNVSNVTQAANLFNGAILFNQPLDNWDTVAIVNMVGMFNGASLYDQDISNWDVRTIPTEPTDFRTSAPLTDEHSPRWGKAPLGLGPVTGLSATSVVVDLTLVDQLQSANA